MKDHVYSHPDGWSAPVSQLPTPIILTCLQHGVYHDDVESQITPEDIIERLRIELLIRELGL